MTTYAVYNVTTSEIIARGLSMRDAVKLHNSLGHIGYALANWRTLAELDAAAEREAVREAAELLAGMATNPQPYERAIADIDAGTRWSDLGGGWVEVQRPFSVAHLAHRDGCDCPSRTMCRHRALAHAVTFAGRVEDAAQAA